MKKILVLLSLLLLFSMLSVSFVDAEDNREKQDNSNECSYDVENGLINVGDALDTCLEGSKLVNGVNAKLGAGGGFSIQIKYWTNNIALYLGIFSVLSIIIGSLMMTISVGEEDKIKKAKDIVKWGMIGFLGVISVSAIINLVVKIMYSI